MCVCAMKAKRLRIQRVEEQSKANMTPIVRMSCACAVRLSPDNHKTVVYIDRKAHTMLVLLMLTW